MIEVDCFGVIELWDNKREAINHYRNLADSDYTRRDGYMNIVNCLIMDSEFISSSNGLDF